MARLASDQDGNTRCFVRQGFGKRDGFGQVAVDVVGEETDLVRDGVALSPDLEDALHFDMPVFRQALPVQVVFLWSSISRVFLLIPSFES